MSETSFDRWLHVPRKQNRNALPTLISGVVVAVILLASADRLPAQGVPPRPLRFFETYYLLSNRITETNILQYATNMVNYGYVAAGWDGILIDEPWLGGHDASGNCYANSNAFPHGMSWLIGKLHAMGLQAGLFFTLGHNGVAGPGSWGYWEQDATNAANWGTDFVYLVVDDYGYGDGVNYNLYQRFIGALPTTGKKVTVLGTTHQWDPWLANSLDGGQLWVWPGYVDFHSTQSALLRAVDNLPAESFNVRPGHYLMYGWFAATIDYSGNWSLDLFKAVYGMMALWHSPMSFCDTYAGNEIPDWHSVHTNRTMLAIDADPGAFTPALVASNQTIQVWSEPLGATNSGQRAVGFLNRSSSLTGTNAISVGWTNFGLADGIPYTVQDVWGGTTFATSTGGMTATVPPYGCNLYIVSTPTPLFAINTTSSPPAGGITTGGGPMYGISSTTICARPNAGYFFANWTEDGGYVSSSPCYAFTATTNRTLVANFAQGQQGLPPTNWSVTTISFPTNGGLTGGGGSYSNGQTVTVCATPNPCYSFADWTTNGSVASSSSCFTFAAAGLSHLTANFALTTFSIGASSAPLDGGSTSGGGVVNCGDSVTLSATANAGHQFANWTENGNVAASSAGYTFTATGNRTLVANFSQITFAITTLTAPPGGGVASGGGMVNFGANVTLTATTNRRYQFMNWTEDGGLVSTSSIWSFIAISDRTLTANFVPDFPLLYFGSPLWNGAGLNLMLAGPIGSNYVIESSTDLFNWSLITNFTTTNSPFHIQDPSATNHGQQFYRSLLLP